MQPASRLVTALTKHPPSTHARPRPRMPAARTRRPGDGPRVRGLSMSTAYTDTPGVRRSAPLLAAVALAHGGLLAALLGPADTLPVASPPPQPLTVSLIEAKRQMSIPASDPTPPVRRRPAPVHAAADPASDPEPPPVPETPAIRATPVPEPAPEPLVPHAAKPTPSPAPEAAASMPAPRPQAVIVPPHPADYRVNPKPPYPPLSRRLGEAGTVHLDILVNPDGSVAKLTVAKTSGYPRLDRSAIETVRSHWKFEPAREDGKPVALWVTVPIQFTLRS